MNLLIGILICLFIAVFLCVLFGVGNTEIGWPDWDEDST